MLENVENQERFDAFLNQLIADEQPVGQAEIELVVKTHLEAYARYHAAQDRAYQRASAEFQKRKKERRLAEIGFESQRRAQAEQIRKAEKHAVHIATANLRKQREEMKVANDLAKILPPDFDPSALNSLFAAAAPHLTPPGFNRS